MLMHAGGGVRGIKDVTATRRRSVVECISDMNVSENRSGVLKHALHIASHVERVSGAVEVSDRWRIYGSDKVDSCVAVFDKVIRMWLQVKFQAFLLKDWKDYLQ